MAVKVLIFSASIGEGHDLPARVLRDALVETAPGTQVEIVDGVKCLGAVGRRIIENGAELSVGKNAWLADAQYRAIERWRVTRGIFGVMLRTLGTRHYRRIVAEQRPDVIVSTYPGTTECLAILRRAGKLSVPCVSAITDLAGMRYWSAPGIDLHLLIHPESEAEVRSIAGPATEIVTVRGLTDPAFDVPVSRVDGRAAVGEPLDGALVAVSGGGWGVGDLEGAVEVALAVPGAPRVVVLCGRSDELRERLTVRFSGEPRVRVLGFTDQMSEWLAAADVLVHSTAGLTVLEAIIRGCAVVSYGWGIAHIRSNNEAYERFGLARVAKTRKQLGDEIAAALADPPGPDGSFAQLPQAAPLVLALAQRAAHREPRPGIAA